MKKRSNYSLEIEEENLKQLEYDRRVRDSRIYGNVRVVFKELKKGNLIDEPINNFGIGQEVVNAVRDYKRSEHSHTEELIDLLIYLERSSKLLDDVKSLKRVVRLFYYYDKRIRDPLTWKPSTKNMGRQFNSLARHMLVKYDMPDFMDNAWDAEYHVNDYKKAIEWYLVIGNGGNLRKCENLPFPVTKKIAHLFLQTPVAYEVEEGLVWGLIHSMGGGKRHIFCKTVIQFFVNNPMFDLNQFGPVIDYIWSKKYDPQRMVIDGEVLLDYVPEQRNFSMNGRDPLLLMNQVEEWHKVLGKQTKRGDMNWESSKYRSFQFIEGNITKGTQVTWDINELLSSSALRAEGKAMKHCVASYDRSCKSGRCSIFSLERMSINGTERCLTLEITHEKLAEARGKYNRRPSHKEMDILRKWSAREGLSVSKYLGEDL